MKKIKIITFVFPVLIVLNISVINAQDTAMTGKSSAKKIFHDFHIGLQEVHFFDEMWYSYWWTTLLPNYSIMYKNNNVFISGYLAWYYSRNSEGGAPLRNRFWKAIEIAAEMGIKEKYSIKYRYIPSIRGQDGHSIFGNTIGFIDYRFYTINDYQASYTFFIKSQKLGKLKIGGGITNCYGRESKLIGISMHSGGWFEGYNESYDVADKGYIFEMEYYIRPRKHISFRAFANYRTYKDIVPFFSYGISGGVSF